MQRGVKAADSLVPTGRGQRESWSPPSRYGVPFASSCLQGQTAPGLQALSPVGLPGVQLLVVGEVRCLCHAQAGAHEPEGQAQHAHEVGHPACMSDITLRAGLHTANKSSCPVELHACCSHAGNTRLRGPPVHDVAHAVADHLLGVHLREGSAPMVSARCGMLG